METKTRTIIDSMVNDGSCSVLTQTYVVYKGQETIIENHREALVPTQRDRAAEILTEHQYQALMALWTDDIVSSWVEKQGAVDS